MPLHNARTEERSSDSSPSSTPSLSEGATMRPPKSPVRHLALGGFPEQIFSKMQDFARQEGADVESSMRNLLIRALDELKPNVSESARAQAEVKGEWRTIPIGKEQKVERFFVSFELKESHKSLVKAWNCMLTGLLDHYQINLLPITNGRIPICFYPGNDQLVQYLQALKIDLNSLPRGAGGDFDVISREDRAAGINPPEVRLLAPQDLLAFINRSPNFISAIKAPIEAARMRYGGSFAGVDSNCTSLSEGQLFLIERLKVSCEKLTASLRG